MRKCGLNTDDSKGFYPSDTKVTTTFTADGAGLEKGFAFGSSPEVPLSLNTKRRG